MDAISSALDFLIMQLPSAVSKIADGKSSWEILKQFQMTVLSLSVEGHCVFQNLAPYHSSLQLQLKVTSF